MEFLLGRNFEDLLPPNLLQSKKVINTETTPLTAPGENFGSVILSVIITLQNEETNEEKIYTVVKLPPVNEYTQQFMNTPVTFRHELGFYQTLVPCLQEFQQEQNLQSTLTFFPKFFGGKFTPRADDATIFLENLKESGFTIGDRNTGFDLETSKLILGKMAELHGVSLALKIKKPDQFREKFLPYLEEFRIFMADDNPDNLQLDCFIDIALNVNRDLCPLHLTQVKTALDECVKNQQLPRNSSKFTQSKFATLIHNDLWVNNIMIKKHMNKIDVKFLDWQLYEHGSVTRDILFFIFTSVESRTLTENLDDLILFYYRQLIKNLREMRCEDEFSFSEFQAEMKSVAFSFSLFQILVASSAVFVNNTPVDAHEINKESMFNLLKLSKHCQERIRLTTQEFIKKGWLSG